MLYEGLIRKASATISTQVGACGDSFRRLESGRWGFRKNIIGLKWESCQTGRAASGLSLKSVGAACRDLVGAPGIIVWIGGVSWCKRLISIFITDSHISGALPTCISNPSAWCLSRLVERAVRCYRQWCRSAAGLSENPTWKGAFSALREKMKPLLQAVELRIN